MSQPKRKRPTWKQIKRKVLNSPAAVEAARACPVCDPAQRDGLEHATVALTDENGNDYEAGFTKRHNDGQVGGDALTGASDP